MKTQISAVAIIHLALASLGLLMLFLIYLFAGVAMQFIDEPIVANLGPLVLGVIFTILGLKHVITIIGAIGLMKYKNWGRILILIVSALDLLSFPIGTALGVYSFWALLNNESQQLFD
ncbi:hypothetical protein EMN47_15560 [Prolixibacteraceae bacterium JC049]|nr:hypothetical protein [Prolixibacteraceae bacterium JC049]